MKSPAYERLKVSEGPFDVIVDPEVGKMELLEIGIADKLKYSMEERCAYTNELDFPAVQEILLTLASKFGFTGEAVFETDRITERVTKTDVEFHMVGAAGYWVTFWYDGGIGNLHCQEKMELLIKVHGKYPLDRFDFIDARKRVWVQKIADMSRENYKRGMELDEFNRFIKKNELLSVLEDITGMGYDVFDFLKDVNSAIIG